MISKIHNIRAIGKFTDYSPREPLDLGKLTLIYSDNGRGKSTLADILRALALGDTDRLMGRRALKCNFNPLVKFELESGQKLIFANQKWHGQFCNIQVFDDVFISDNIYAGISVGTEHYRNLAQIIIGKTAVRAQKREDDLKVKRDNKKHQKENIENKLREHILSYDDRTSGKMPIDDYVALEPVSDINNEVEQQESLVKQLQGSDQLLRAANFSEVALPKLPISELENLLGKSLVQIEEHAEQRVNNHLSHYSSGGVEDWIERGTRIVTEQADFCPFCGQNLSSSQLITYYQSYFNQEYQQLKREISNFADEQLVFEVSINMMYQNSTRNSSAHQFWRERIPELSIKTLNIDEVKQALSVVVSQIKQLLDIKKGKPLDRLQLTETATQALKHWRNVEQKVEGYNEEVRLANTHISKHQDNVKSADIQMEQRKLSSLRNSLVRYSPDVADLCQSYTEAKQELQELEQQISKTREEINISINDLFAKYRDEVNKYLDCLGADFTIGDFSQTRDRTSVLLRKYSLVISGEKVEVGKPNEHIDIALFRNTLSAGDRRTLAFAYFLAQLEALPDLSDTIVVFDDPMTSLDTNRRAKTINAIRKVSDVAKQVIVMSHDAFFLHEFWQRHNGNASIIKICAAPGNDKPSKLVGNWEIEAEVRDREAKNYKRVLEFVDGISTESDNEDILRCARILLERRCRMLYLDICQKANTFGSFMECVLQNRCDSPEYSNLNEYNEKVKEIVNILNRSNHSDLTARRPPNEAETRDLCNDVLRLLGRI